MHCQHGICSNKQKKPRNYILFILVCLFFTVSVHAESAKEAWKALVPINYKSKPAFAFVENNPELPNVLIYGDSISISYTVQVRDQLKSHANVYRLYCNGGYSTSFIRKMIKMNDTMRDKEKTGFWRFNWDVIHFNVGLHDLKYVLDGKLDAENGKQVTISNNYEKNLRLIVDYLQKIAPKAKLIFATTTPVSEATQGRRVEDVVKYNKIAVKVMNEYTNITINDLYKYTMLNHTKSWQPPKDVHFNKIGREALGNEVARVIKEIL